MTTQVKIIGELINNSFGRARRAWVRRDVLAYQELARTQVKLGASYLTVNLDGTQNLQVCPKEMLALLPELIPALQEVTAAPFAFDNPWLEYHRVALQSYDRLRGGPPILNSLAASRPQLDQMVELVGEFDMWVIVMASERFIPGGTAQCLTAEDAYIAARQFVQLLRTRAGRQNNQIIIDPGLAPIGADTYGLVNIGLDTMRLIQQDPELEGVHLSVGLTNLSWGIPKELRIPLERAYLTLAVEGGLDMALANPEKNPQPLDPDDPMVAQLRRVLEAGRPQAGESQEDAGFRQAESMISLCNNA